jgi:PAS domain S-box-containing protein
VSQHADRASIRDFRALLANVADMVTISDREGRIIYASPATEQVSGYTPEEFMARNPFDSIHPEDRPRCEEALARLVNSPGLSLDLEHRVRHKDGTWRWMEGTFTSLYDDPGVGGLLATVRDITERKRQEQRQDFLLKLSDVLRSTDDAEAIQEQAARILGEQLGVGRAFYFAVEREAEGYIYVARKDYYRHPEMQSLVGRYPQATFGERVLENLPNGETLIVPDVKEHSTFGPDGLERYLAMQIQSFVAVPLMKKGEYVAGFVMEDAAPRSWSREEIALVEETAESTWAAVERARAEDALRRSEEQLQLALDASAMGTFTWYPKEDRGEPDERMLELFGLPKDNTLNLAVALETMVHTDDRERYAEAVARAIDPAGTGELREDIRVIHHDGTQHWLAVTAQVHFEGESPMRMVGSAMDITGRRRAEEERERLRVREATMRAEAAERERISRELHDRVAHSMGVVYQSLQLHRALAERDPERARQKLEVAEETRKRISRKMGRKVHAAPLPGVLRRRGARSRVASFIRCITSSA